MKALRIYAGPAARKHIEAHGLRPQDAVSYTHLTLPTIYSV